MLHLDLTALFEIASEHGLSANELALQEKNIPPFLKKIAERKQGFFSDEVLQNAGLLAEIEATARKLKNSHDHIVVLGIGGSALGTRALQEAFTNPFAPNSPKLHVLDNIDPTLIAELETILDLERTLFIVITKSGSTPETLSQYFYFRKKVQAAGISEQKAFIFITDPEAGLLAEEARAKNIIHFPVPPNVGGRFSVLTAVGLIPAAFMGIDIQQLLQGANQMRAQFLSENFAENLPFQIAAVQYLLAQKGKSIHVLMPYAQKLFRFADWYRQLLAESIGKALNSKGEKVHVGITPVNALGVTDQHSQLQLYLEGPFDKLIIFLAVEKFPKDFPIPAPDSDERTNFLQKVRFSQLLHTEKKATARALTEGGRPHITVTIPTINEEALGALFFLFEAATAFLGEYFEIDAFDQPGVERAKILTRKFLKN